MFHVKSFEAFALQMSTPSLPSYVLWIYSPTHFDWSNSSGIEGRNWFRAVGCLRLWSVHIGSISSQWTEKNACWCFSLIWEHLVDGTNWCSKSEKRAACENRGVYYIFVSAIFMGKYFLWRKCLYTDGELWAEQGKWNNDIFVGVICCLSGLDCLAHTDPFFCYLALK